MPFSDLDEALVLTDQVMSYLSFCLLLLCDLMSSQEVPFVITYRIAGNFQGIKLLLFSWITAAP